MHTMAEGSDHVDLTPIKDDRSTNWTRTKVDRYALCECPSRHTITIQRKVT